MLYDFKWLQPGSMFPPPVEADRILRYKQNSALFDGDHFVFPGERSRNGMLCATVGVFQQCAERISRVVGNFEEVVSFPTLLNYQRLMTLKMADLVCGEYPTLSGATPDKTVELLDISDYSNLNTRLYSTVLDISRYGDAIWRVYKDEEEHNTFTCWDPSQWFPVVAQDGTNSIKAHCLCWRENLSPTSENPVWVLHVQIHGCAKNEIGVYTSQLYEMGSDGVTIYNLISSETVETGLNTCAIFHLEAFKVTNSVYGYDDYMPIDSLLAEILARVGQISAILDKHADPCITGPVSMLSVDPVTGEQYLKTGKFYATSPGEEQPSYMTWDGQLTSAFKQLEFLINQLYILSEMGAAILGGQDGSSQAISGTAMRFKMVNPLAKARRIANSLTKPVRMLLSCLSDGAIDYSTISVAWSDGLPEDPRENIEMVKLATGEEKLMPLTTAIVEFFGRKQTEAEEWLKRIKEEALTSTEESPNHAGPQDGTGVNTSEKGSTTGLTNFKGLNNK